MSKQLASGFVITRLGQHADGGHAERIGSIRSRQGQQRPPPLFAALIAEPLDRFQSFGLWEGCVTHTCQLRPQCADIAPQGAQLPGLAHSGKIRAGEEFLEQRLRGFGGSQSLAPLTIDQAIQQVWDQRRGRVEGLNDLQRLVHEPILPGVAETADHLVGQFAGHGQVAFSLLLEPGGRDVGVVEQVGLKGHPQQKGQVAIRRSLGGPEKLLGHRRHRRAQNSDVVGRGRIDRQRAAGKLTQSRGHCGEYGRIFIGGQQFETLVDSLGDAVVLTAETRRPHAQRRHGRIGRLVQDHIIGQARAEQGPEGGQAGIFGARRLQAGEEYGFLRSNVRAFRKNPLSHATVPDVGVT